MCTCLSVCRYGSIVRYICPRLYLPCNVCLLIISNRKWQLWRVRITSQNKQHCNRANDPIKKSFQDATVVKNYHTYLIPKENRYIWYIEWYIWRRLYLFKVCVQKVYIHISVHKRPTAWQRASFFNLIFFRSSHASSVRVTNSTHDIWIPSKIMFSFTDRYIQKK